MIFDDNDILTFFTEEEEKDIISTDEDIPPSSEPNTALILAFDCETYMILAHTGPYFWMTCEEAGETFTTGPHDSIGIDSVPDEPGYYMFDGGGMENVNIWTDWETGHSEWDGITGDIGRAHVNDFKRFGVEVPIEGIE